MEQTFIQEFIKTYHEADGSFNLYNKGNERHCHFIKDKVGLATYIYGAYAFHDPAFYYQISLKPQLVAIEMAGVMYILDEFFFGIYKVNRYALPENCKYFSDCNVNVYVQNEAFPAFYESLKVDDSIENIPADAMRHYLTDARECLFKRSGAPKEHVIENLFNENECAACLCGIMDLEEEISKRLEERREKWMYIKTNEEKVSKLIASGKAAAEWEIRLAEGIRGVAAQSVVIEFEFNGNTAKEKTSPEKVLHLLVQNDSFDDWDFSSRAKGKALFETLGASTKYNEAHLHLKCEHIKKITYGKRELYVK